MQNYRVFVILPKTFQSVLVPLYLEPIRGPLLAYAANLFLRIVSMQRLVPVMEICIEVRSSVQPNFLWFAWAWRFSTIRLSMRFWMPDDFAWLLMLRLGRILSSPLSQFFWWWYHIHILLMLSGIVDCVLPSPNSCWPFGVHLLLLSCSSWSAFGLLSCSWCYCCWLLSVS